MLPGEVTVPNLTLLGLDKAALRCVYDSATLPLPKVAKTAKDSGDIQTVADKVDWMSTWFEYVRGNIVSNSAARLIQSFLLNTWASSTAHADNDESEADASEEETELPPLKLSSEKIGEMLPPSATTTTINQEEDNKKTEDFI